MWSYPVRLALLAAVASFALTARGPLTHEQMWLLPRVGAPAPSPDGKWVAVSVVEPAYDSKNQSSDLWLIAADGSGSPRRLTFTRGSESGAVWSPDSKQLAFAAKRDGDEDTQIYLLDLAAGGEARRLTEQAGGASSPVFSPDGKSIAYQSAYDPVAAERKTRKHSARVYDSF
ncbi:MAG: PD40 domain-containing protein, partial [Bryobacterales bacterium]|nr:PD40 domain-containing protein [Bryobacterales bacterium]